MKKLVNITFLMLLLFIVVIDYGTSSDKIRYVGVKENDEFIWKYTIDSDGQEDFLEDLDIELQDEDILDYKGRKIIINHIDNEEHEYGYDYLNEDFSYKGVELEVETYYTEDFEKIDWKIDEDEKDTVIFEFNEDLYVLLVLTSFLTFMPPFLATNVDWEKISDDLEDAEDIYEDIKDIDVEIIEKILKVTIEWSKDYYENDVKEEIILKYTEAGVLEYFILEYEGDQIVLIELLDNNLEY